MRNSILFLAFISGICGIAYEVLYSRLLSTYFGSTFYVTAAILIAFLFSIGLGSLFGHRFVRYISLIEISIGLYALGAIVFFNTYALDLIVYLSALSVSLPLVFTGFVTLFLIIPALLIGFSIPIFSLYLTKISKTTSIFLGFTSVYILYNIGAALSVIFVEYFLLRNFGITVSIVSIAFLNIVNGIVLLKFVPLSTEVDKPQVNTDIPRSYWQALFLVSIASGIFQLFLLKTANNIFGPLNENFAIVLSILLFGMVFATLLSRRIRMSYSTFLLSGSVLVLVLFLTLTPFIYFWALLQESIGVVYGISWLIKPSMLFVLSILVFTFFGGTTPFLMQGNKSNTFSVGKALAIASFGNAIGFFLMTIVLYERLSDKFIPLFISAIIILGGSLTVKRIQIRGFFLFVSVVVLSIGVMFTWPEGLLGAGYKSLNALENITYINISLRAQSKYKKYNDDVSILYFHDGSRWLSLNGYTSLRFRDDNLASLREMIVGLSPAMYSQAHKKALVLGLGSGVTAGATAQVYDNTTVVEINPAMLDVLPEFTYENMNVLNNESVNIIIQDGIIALLQTKEKYDAIVNTVPSPTYYSASKLWTKEIFNIISTKLAPGGVYSMWFDLNLNVEGVKVLAKTVEDSFVDCRYIFLTPSYFNVICSNEKITFKNIPDSFWSGVLHERFENYNLNGTIGEFFADITLNPSKTLLFDDYVAYNTLDLPVLEFVELSEGYDNRKIREFLYALINSNFKHSSFSSQLLTSKELDRRCKNLSILSQYSLYIDECNALESWKF